MRRAAPHAESSARIARRLLARNATVGRDDRSAASAAGLQQTLASVSERLRDALGDDGRTALLARALSRTEKDHPSLLRIRRVENEVIQLDGVAASVETDGMAVVTAAIEALLAAVIDVLSRLIGEDMALRIIGDEDMGAAAGDDARAP